LGVAPMPCAIVARTFAVSGAKGSRKVRGTRKAARESDVVDGSIGRPQHRRGTSQPQLLNMAMGRSPNGALEYRGEVIAADSGLRRERFERKRFIVMGFDEIQ